MSGFIDFFVNAFYAFGQFNIRDVIDILIISLLIYKLLVATRKTRAIQVFKGIGILLVAAILAEFFGLVSVRYILDTVLQSGVIFVIILFQPEIRKALEGIGRGSLFSRIEGGNVSAKEEIVAQFTKAILEMAKTKTGALIVFQKNSSLIDVISTGTVIDAKVSSALIQNIFVVNTPLHDGAMVVSDGVIRAAGCILPLSENFTISKKLGTRHRAALGISEVTDSITFVVSEETGVISYSKAGKLIRYLDKKNIVKILEEILVVEKSKKFIFPFRRKNNEKQEN